MADSAPTIGGERLTSLVGFVTETAFEDVPVPVRERTKLVLLDTVGSLLAASDPKYDPGRTLAEFVDEGGGGTAATLVGSGRRASCEDAALVNGTLGYFCDLDAHHPEAITHTPAVVIPAALAVGEREAATGRDLLLATVLGVEVACRVSLALNPAALYERGFHPTSVAGGFGAATAAAKLLDLDTRACALALGLAQTQASGVLAWKDDPTESLRPFNPGIAARNGVTAALLARAGFGSPVDPFEGEYNVFRAFSNGREDRDRLDSDLGESFAIRDHAFKRYSSVAFSHPSLDALLGILDGRDLGPEDVVAVEVRFPATGAELVDDAELNSHSLQYLLAVAAVEGGVDIDAIVDDRRSDPDVKSLMERITLIRDETLDRHFPARYTSIVTVETESDSVTSRVDHAEGTPEKPFDAAEVEAKFRRLSAETTTEERQSEIVAAVNDVEALEDVDELIALLR